MKIRDEHLYIGSALLQVAEHKNFTAINSLKCKGKIINNAFRINDHIGLYCKYATSPTGVYEEYVFTFQESHIGNVDEIGKSCAISFLALVCVEAREVCCISIDQFYQLVKWRRESTGRKENQYQIRVTAKENQSLRVYINNGVMNGKVAGEMIVVKRSAFPGVLFD